jgi:hypothetical protein
MPADQKRWHSSSNLDRIGSGLRCPTHRTSVLGIEHEGSSPQALICQVDAGTRSFGSRLVSYQEFAHRKISLSRTAATRQTRHCGNGFLVFLLYVSITTILALSQVFGTARHWYPSNQSKRNDLRRLRYGELSVLICGFKLSMA